MDLGLEGRVAVVTGGSKGIGAAIATELATEGVDLALCARGEDELRSFAEHLAGTSGRRVLAVPADVTDADSVESLRQRVLAEYGQVDILVNNAGRAYPGRFDTLTDQDFMDDYDVKALSHVRVTRAFLPSMKEKGRGRVININSIHGRHPDPRFFTSSVNRAASIALSRVLALSLATENIQVNSVNIGYVRTPQWSNVHQRTRPDLETEEFFDWIAGEDVPMGRMGRPEEVAAMVALLASDRVAYVTGASIDVGGGMG